MKKALVSLSALLLLVSACGGETQPSRTEDGKKIVKSLAAGVTDTAQGIEAADARCIATRFVDDLGVAGVVKGGAVTKSFTYTDGALDKASASAKKGFAKARAHCLEAKIAASMATVISTKDGLLSKTKATCVANAFTRSAGIDKLVGGQAVTTQLEYVRNGAISDPGNAADYADALTRCVGNEKVADALTKAVEKAFASGAGGPAIGNVTCLVKDFVKDVGVEGLMANKLITDTGEFNTAGAKYDNASAKSLATAILGCVDALKSQAETAAAADKTLNVAKLEACLKKAITTEFLRDEFLTNQLLGNDAKAQEAASTIQARSQTCEQAQK